MPIRPPALDDRDFDSLVNELVARIPAHTPEWTNPRVGDPGRTLLELFAWLGETLLYRANLIPERQRLAFLRLLGEQMRPAQPARGLVTLHFKEDTVTEAVDCPVLSTVSKPVPFETRTEISVLPITAEWYIKRPLTTTERADSRMNEVIEGLRLVYRVSGRVKPYVTTPVFVNGASEAAGVDVVNDTVDRALWMAILAPKPDDATKAAVLATLGGTSTGASRLLNIGVAPTLAVPDLDTDIGTQAKIPILWELSRLDARGRTDYTQLDVVEDTTTGLTRRGVVRVALPQSSMIGAPTNDPRQQLLAGVGDQPPRLDNPKTAARLVAWVRLRPNPKVTVTGLRLSWAGVNAVTLDQRETVTSRVIGVSSGAADQEFALPGRPIEPETLVIQVEGESGFQAWGRLDDLAVAGRDTTAYTLDAEAGTIRFGDGLRGRVPPLGGRIRVAVARVGGGKAGNVPPNSLSEFVNRDPNGRTISLKVMQPLPTEGGDDAETLIEAEQRIPARFRHKERAVTRDDYRALAVETPGVRVGRVEVLPRFRPFGRQSNVPGTVSVMVLPGAERITPPAPRADRPLLEAVHAYLEERRPLATELYVIGAEYVPLGIGIGVTVRDGFAIGEDGTPLSRDAVLTAVREAVRRFLWALAPGGVEGQGWELGRAVRDRELEVIISRVPGVSAVAGVNLFRERSGEWEKLRRRTPDAPIELFLEPWQLPELLSLVVAEDLPDNLRGVPNPFADADAVAIPVIPKVC